MADSSRGLSGQLQRYLPILSWLPAYRREWLSGDIAAGLTAWAVTVPVAMAFAGIAGMPVQYGLYAACLAPACYALFGTSHHLNVGPVATAAAISAATVMPLAVRGTPVYITLVAVLALIVGALLTLGGLARAGFLSKLLARPVLDGYIVGTAIFIAVGQLEKLFGVEAGGGNTFIVFADILRQAGSWSWITLSVGIGCLLLLILLRMNVPRVPAALTVMVLSIPLAYLFSAGEHGVALVGELPRGVSILSLEGVGISDVVRLLPGALALALFAFTESLPFARAYAVKHSYKVDPNQEMIALGVANIGSGFLRGFTVDASFTRTAASEQAGGKTQLASLICSGLTLVTVFLFTGLFKYLPLATLAAIVVFTVARLVDLKPLLRLRRSSRDDFALALVALFGVLLFGVVVGILIGVVLSLAGFVVRVSRPHTAVLGVDESGAHHGALKYRPGYKSYAPHLIIYRFDSPLIFVNVDRFVDDIRRLVDEADPKPRAVIVDCEVIYEMDTTASDEFAGLHAALSGEGIEVLLACVHSPLRSFMQRDGVIDIVGEENVFNTLHGAVQSFKQRYPDLCQ
jgi:sulfate permease, SulP family